EVSGGAVGYRDRRVDGVRRRVGGFVQRYIQLDRRRRRESRILSDGPVRGQAGVEKDERRDDRGDDRKKSGQDRQRLAQETPPGSRVLPYNFSACDDVHYGHCVVGYVPGQAASATSMDAVSSGRGAPSRACTDKPKSTVV